MARSAIGMAQQGSRSITAGQIGARVRLGLGPLGGEAVRTALAAALLAWVAGVVGWLALGRAPGTEVFDPFGLTEPFGAAGDLLTGPLARWDSAWYLAIATDGYDATRAAFFPLYPLLAAVAGSPLRSPLLGGAVVSLACFAAGLWAVGRLAAIELGPALARPSMLLVAFFPTAFFFPAVYSESLFLACSAGAFLAARTGRWWLAGALGACGAATRSAGVLLVVPLLLLWCYGPRADRPPAVRRGWRPAYALTGRATACLLPLAGLAAYLVYLAAAIGDAGAPFRVQDAWHRELAVPFSAAWDGVVAAWDGARQLLSGSRTPVYFTEAGGDPFEVARRNLVNLPFLVFAVVALAGALRRLPIAYGAWAAVALTLPLSVPVGPQPLMSLPRFLAVLFPLQLWLALWSSERRRFELVLAGSAAAMGCLAAVFASWRWVA
jgi:Mannosyltransferase (PIG-V)